MTVKQPSPRSSTLLQSESGVALTEFALCIPVLLILYLGSYVLSDAIACNRKVTIATRTITDLTTRYPNVSETDVSTILNASAQVMAPYNQANALVRVSEIQVTDSSHAKVIWSRSINGKTLTANNSISIPNGMATVGTYLVFGEVNYAYTPIISFNFLKPTGIYDRIYMSPRLSDQIPISS
jgi:Flp pilus assembly protein TadG